MRDDGKQQGGDLIEKKPPLFIGAAWTPMGEPIEFRPLRLKKKVDAGANFIQTQAVYDVKLFAEQMKIVCDMGLHERTAILPGVIIPRSMAMLRYMHNSVSGVTVPDALIKRMGGAKEAAGDDKKQAKLNQEEEGVKIAVELIEQIREIPGVKGVHVQAIEWERKVPEIFERAGLLPRPEITEGPLEPAEVDEAGEAVAASA